MSERPVFRMEISGRRGLLAAAALTFACIGPAGPAGDEKDREIISFDGRVLVTRFIDKDAAVRYGNMVYVRCAPHA